MHVHLAHSVTPARRRGFTLAELLVVIGVLALLAAIVLPALQAAHKQALTLRCGTQVRELGRALETARTENRDFYPVWDDGGAPTRFTWIDVLIQRNHLADRRVAYCPMDLRPDPLNSARGAEFGVVYPGGDGAYGIDYSYGIGVPLSAAGWIVRGGASIAERRYFENHDRFTAQRVLTADAHWSCIYNLSGDALMGHDWSWPTQYDNMIAYRHPTRAANVCYQDGHVGRLIYQAASTEPINTATSFVWQPTELLNVGAADVMNGYAYPNIPPVSITTGEGSGAYPYELSPGYYTHNRLWTVSKD